MNPQKLKEQVKRQRLHRTHDDVFWATALAVYATANMEPEPFLAVIPR